MTAWADNPQAAQIDALIERAGRLSEFELDGLHEARVEAGAEAWEAAWEAALEAALEAGRVVAWNAAEDAALDAALEAGWEAGWVAAGAANALVVRDLVREGTSWDQAAYDLLTGEWRRVIGPIHPDEKEI